MKFNALLYLALIFLVFQSCGVRKFDPSMQNALFSADYKPNTEGNICTQGYYLPYDINCNKFRSGRGFCLSDNGMITYGILFAYMYPMDSLSTNKMDEFIDNGNFDFNYYNNHTEKTYGGIYKISGDTLITDCYYRIYSTFCDNWGLKTTRYKIIDRETLVEIPTGNDSKEKLRLEFCGPRVYRFVPATKLPDEFISSVRDPKWMWKNEEDWKAYKKARDEYKKSLWQQTP